MNILVTTPLAVFPSFSGGSIRTVKVSLELSKLGHRVTLLSAEKNGTRPTDALPFQTLFFHDRGRFGHFYNPSFLRTYVKALEDSPELVVAELPYQAYMLVPAAKRLKVPIVYNSQNVETDKFAKMRRRIISNIVKQTESHICKHASEVLAVSKHDQSLFRRMYDRNSMLLPNGVDTEQFSPHDVDVSLLSQYGLVNKKVVLYFGSFEYPPNLEALKFLIDRWPEFVRSKPDARLLVVGRHVPRWAHRPNIVVCGAVQDIVAHIRLAHVVAVPLSSGGGTRLKILEALSCGQTVLSTPFGATGLPEVGGTGIVRVELKNFMNRLRELIDISVRCGNIQSRHTALQYDWAPLVRAIPWEKFAQNRGTGSHPAPMGLRLADKSFVAKW